MASVALGLVGGFLFGPAGYLVGSLIGSLLDPAKQEGPRLQSLKLQVSQYGEMVKDVWGTMRIAGNVIWIGNGGNLVEHKHESGGKGGPQVTTYTYTASFAVGLCNRVNQRESAILGIAQIYADSRLIWGRGVSDADAIPMTVYLGNETQTADPTMEADLGAQNVPGYRGTAYVVFTDWDLSQFFNRIPNLEFVVYTNIGDIPIRVSTWDAQSYPGSGTPSGVIANADGTITQYVYGVGGLNTAYSFQTYQRDGTPVGSPITGNIAPGLVYATVTNMNCVVSDPGTGAAFYVNGAVGHSLLGGWPTPIGVSGMRIGDVVYFPSSSFGNGITGYPIVNDPGGDHALDQPQAVPVGYLVLGINPANMSIGHSTDGYVYVWDGDSGDMYKCEPDLSGVVKVWAAADFPSDGGFYRGGFVRYGDFFAQNYNFPVSQFRLNLISIADSGLTNYPQPRGPGNSPDFVFLGGNIAPLGDGYYLGKDGVILLDPPLEGVPLSEIVTDVSGDCGLGPSQIDVTELTDIVDGFVIGTQMTGRNRLEPTRNAYYYDGVESDSKVKFRKRGRASVVTIPDEDLAAFITGTTPPAQLVNERAQEFDLPQQLTVEYINNQADYQTGSQYAQRQVTNSQSKVALQLPISMTDAKGAEVANVLLDSAWAEREKYTIIVPRKYAYLDPTDVFTAKDRDIRILTREEVGTTTIKWEGVQEFQEIYTQAAIAIPASGMPPVTPPSPTPTTDALLLDIPLVQDSDTPQSGFYSAMAPIVAGPWPGASLNRSIDGGVSYAQLLVDNQADGIGSTVDALGSWDPNNNIFDEVNAVTVLMNAGQTLSGASADAVLNGANLALIGDELVQFKNATLIDTDTYTLSGLLRGRRGTEWATGTHVSDERFVLLPVDRADVPLSELYLDRFYKAVTAGQTIAGATAQEFTNTGNGLRPYSPVQLGGGVDASGNVTLAWTRRTRIGGAWMPFVDVPLSEPTEQYVVQIWNSTHTLVAFAAVLGGGSTTVYPASQQIIDFGALQETIFFTISQLGVANIGTEARGSVKGAGSTNDAPLNPIPPYGS